MKKKTTKFHVFHFPVRVVYLHGVGRNIIYVQVLNILLLGQM